MRAVSGNAGCFSLFFLIDTCTFSECHSPYFPRITGTCPVPGYGLETGCQSDIVDCLTLCVHSQAIRQSTTTKIRV